MKSHAAIRWDESGREAALIAGQGRVLEMIATGAPFQQTLDALVRTIEADSPELLGSILLLDDDGKHLRHGAAPSLPAAYSRAIDGGAIGPRAGSCGTAAFRREQVLAADIEIDPLWADHRDLAAAHGLRACWSTPIFDANRRVLGTFALYFRAPALPTDRHAQLIEMATHTAAIAIVSMKSRQERAKLMHALRTSESMFRSIFENAAIGVTIADMERRLKRYNPAFSRMLGYTETELVGRNFAELTHPDDVEPNAAVWHTLASAEVDHFALDKRYLHKDGRVVWAHITVSLIPPDASGEGFTIGMIEDITARKHAEESARASAGYVQGILEGMTVGFVALDRGWRFTYVNARAAEILGHSVESLLGRKYHDVFPEAEGSPFEVAYRRVMAERVTLTTEDYFAPWKRWFEQRVDPTQDGISIFFRDVTESKKSEARVEYLATHDELTDLPNRSLMQDRITRAIAHARRAGEHAALMYLDLDRFKVINEGFGRPFGDAVIRLAADRLKGLVRESDAIGRLSGDEFLVLLADPRRSTDAYVVAQKALDALAQPIQLEGREVFLSASVGVSIFPQDGNDAETLIANASAAMYRAKERGRNTYQFFSREMGDEIQGRVGLETKLRLAVAQRQLYLVYQPKVSLATGQITGCEALLRWNHPELGAVSPAQFIPVAEESGLIVPIGDWVLRTACAQGRAWLDAGAPPAVLSVNLSTRQFLQQDVVAWVLGVLRESGLPPAQLELELTESLIAQDAEKVTATVNQLKAHGVRFSIDDFGTGYSSLSYLKRFRVDNLKIDQSFVRHMLSERGDAAIVLAVISLAHRLGLTVIAEGVETAEHCAFLRQHGCDEMQGYYFSKPLPVEEFAQLVASGRRLAA